MDIKSIVVPYDKSEPAKNALKYAIDILDGAEDATLEIAYVVDLPDYSESDYRSMAIHTGLSEQEMERLTLIKEAYFDEALTDLKANVGSIIDECNCKVVFNLLQGKPDAAICKFAEEAECDLIIMGCRGLNAVRGMLGSVSYGVLRRADKPVLIVK